MLRAAPVIRAVERIELPSHRQRMIAARSSLLSTWEPVVTVLLAAALLGDRLLPVQLLGGVFIIAAVIVVQWAHLWKWSAPTALK